MATTLDAAVKTTSNKPSAEFYLEAPKTPVAPKPSPLQSSSLHFVRTTSVETPTARGFLRSLSEESPVFKSPPKKRTARKSLKDILGGTEPYTGSPGGVSTDDSSVCSAPAQFQRHSPKSTVLLSATTHTFASSSTLSLRPYRVTAGAFKNDDTKAAAQLFDNDEPNQPQILAPNPINLLAVTMTSSNEAAPTSLKDRIAMFQQGMDKNAAAVDGAQQPSKGGGSPTTRRRSSKERPRTKMASTEAVADVDAVTSDIKTGLSRRSSGGTRRTSGKGDIAGGGVADAVKKMQARNQATSTSNKKDTQQQDSDDGESDDGSKTVKTGSLKGLPNGSDHSERGGVLSLSLLYARQTNAPSGPNDTGAETDDASVVVETAEQISQRKARRQVAREQLQVQVEAGEGTINRHAASGGVSSSDEESVAPDRLRRAGKRKVKLKASDLGLTEAELKSMDPHQLQERIRQWKNENPKAGENDQQATIPLPALEERGRGREADNKVSSRSRSRADVKRRSKSITRRPSCKGSKAEDALDSTDKESRGRSTSTVDNESLVPESSRRRAASRRRNSKMDSGEEDDKSTGTALTATTSRRSRSMSRRKSGAASVVSSAESTIASSRTGTRSKSMGRSKSSHGPSALGTALDKVSSHGDAKDKKTDQTRSDAEHKTHRRSKSIGHMSAKTRRIDETSSPPREQRKPVSDQAPESSRRSHRSPERSQASSDDLPASPRRRARSSAPTSRRSSRNDVAQFEPAAVASQLADPLTKMSRRTESPARSTHSRSRKHHKDVEEDFGRVSRTGDVVEPEMDTLSPTTSEVNDKSTSADTFARKPMRTVSEMSPTKMSISAFKKIRGVFSSKSSEHILDQLESPSSSPVRSPGRARGTIRTMSGDSIFDVIAGDVNHKSTVESPCRGVLRQPSGGIDTFDTASDKPRKGSRRSSSRNASPEKREVKSILDAGISEEQLQKLTEAGFLISKKE